MADIDDNNEEQNVAEGAAENTLRPGGGSGGAGDRMQTISDIVVNLTKLKGEDLNGFAASIAQIGKETAGTGLDGNASGNKASINAKPSAASMKGVVREELQGLFGEQESLSENFIDNATTLFEAAVTARVALETADLNEQLEEQLAEQSEKMVSEFAERLDTYLDYLAEKWMEDNKIAVEAGIKTELTEGFLEGLKGLFSEHYINLPEDKLDIVEALTDEVQELQEQLNLQINENIAIRSEREDSEINQAVNEAVEGLTEADADRLRVLAEDVEFSDAANLREKLGLLKENFFGGAAPSANGSAGLVIEEVGITEEQAPEVEVIAPTDRMSRYAAAISRDAKNAK